MEGHDASAYGPRVCVRAYILIYLNTYIKPIYLYKFLGYHTFIQMSRIILIIFISMVLLYKWYKLT